MPERRVSPTTRTRARRLRTEMTKAEQLLWNQLRLMKPEGARFRRQAPIGPFIADFACLSAKLLIEVDGATHSTASEIAYDSRREQWLRHQGFDIYRCTNDEVFHAMDGIVMDVRRLVGLPR